MQIKVGKQTLEMPEDDDAYGEWYETELALAGEQILAAPVDRREFEQMKIDGRPVTNLEMLAARAALEFGWLALADQWIEEFLFFLETKVDADDTARGIKGESTKQHSPDALFEQGKDRDSPSETHHGGSDDSRHA